MVNEIGIDGRGGQRKQQGYQQGLDALSHTKPGLRGADDLQADKETDEHYTDEVAAMQVDPWQHHQRQPFEIG